ncbi:MAG: hypothetical protein R3A79_06320 [Nannocystaceae bacterium]
MEGRSPLKIALDALTLGREAAARGEHGGALDAFETGLAALGPRSRRRGRFDATGLRLAAGARARAEGRLDAAVAIVEAALEERIAEYEGRDGLSS